MYLTFIRNVNFCYILLKRDLSGCIREIEMASNLCQIRLGNEVKKRNQIRKQLLEEVNHLLQKLEVAEEHCSKPSFGTVRSYESMIHERCSMLARLSG